MIERFSKFNNSRTEKLRDRGIQVNSPEEMLNSHEVFARPIENLTETLVPGVCFEQNTCNLNQEGDFTNRYRVVFSRNAPPLSFFIDIKNHPTHLNRALSNDEEAVCAINGGFFLLVDGELETPPREIMYGTVVKNGVLTGVQSHDRPVLWVDKEDNLHVSEVAARGKIKIGNIECNWSGCKSTKSPAELVLFGSDSALVRHISDGETTQKRIMDEELSKTPQADDVVDVICEEHGGAIVVGEIRRTGGTSIIKGNFVIQGTMANLETILVGDRVNIEYTDLQLNEITSAITIGPTVTHFENQIDHPINHDQSLGDHPPFTDRRMARSIIYKTVHGDTVFELFDGAPKSDFFKGVTPREVGEILKKDGLDLEWAYFLDPGQSARLAVRHQDGEIEGFGNQHYIRWPNKSNHPYIWAGEHGRAVPSMVGVKIKK